MQNPPHQHRQESVGLLITGLIRKGIETYTKYKQTRNTHKMQTNHCLWEGGEEGPCWSQSRGGHIVPGAFPLASASPPSLSSFSAHLYAVPGSPPCSPLGLASAPTPGCLERLPSSHSTGPEKGKKNKHTTQEICTRRSFYNSIHKLGVRIENCWYDFPLNIIYPA